MCVQHTSAPIFEDAEAWACPLPAVSRTPPPRPKDQLILYFAVSCPSSVPDQSTHLHTKLSLHWASLHHHVYCTPT